MKRNRVLWVGFWLGVVGLGWAAGERFVKITRLASDPDVGDRGPVEVYRDGLADVPVWDFVSEEQADRIEGKIDRLTSAVEELKGLVGGAPVVRVEPPR